MKPIEPRTYWNGSLVGKDNCRGMPFSYSVTVIGEGDEAHPYSLIVNHDGMNTALVEAQERLYHEGKAPAAVVIGVSPAFHEKPDGSGSWELRVVNYARFDSDYSDFLVNELIPHVLREHPFPISHDPDRHLVAGTSCGGVSSFMVAWFHPEFFHRIYMGSPAFCAMDKADELIALIRKHEPLPFRIHMEYSENEPDEYYGNIRTTDINVENALAYSGYDYQCLYFPGEGHASRYGSTDAFLTALSFLWRDYETVPLAPKHQPERFGWVVDPDSVWEACSDFPAKPVEEIAAGTYSVKDNRILFTDRAGNERIAADDRYRDLRAVCLSSDRQRLFTADAGTPAVYAYTVYPDGRLGPRYLFATLHDKPLWEIPGAWSLCADSGHGNDERVYAATELGIQCMFALCIVEVIFDLPSRAIPEEIAFGGEGDRYLYAKTKAGVFRRPMKNAGRRPLGADPA